MMLKKGAYTETELLLSKHLRDPKMASARSMLEQELRDISALRKLRAQAMAALRERDGKEVTLTQSNRPLKGTVGNFDGFIGRSYYLKNKVRMERMTKEEYSRFKAEFNPKRAKKLERLLLQKVPELQQIEEAWQRLKADDWKSIHFDVEKGCVYRNGIIALKASS